jgi:hypothetical protein
MGKTVPFIPAGVQANVEVFVDGVSLGDSAANAPSVAQGLTLAIHGFSSVLSSGNHTVVIYGVGTNVVWQLTTITVMQLQ